MSYEKITIQIKGDPAGDEQLRLYDFITQLDAIRTALIRLEEEIAGPKSPRMQYRVVDLSHQSPATVVLEAVPNPQGPDISALVIDRFLGIIKEIKTGSFPEHADSDLLEPFKRIGPPIQVQTKQPKPRHLSLVSIATTSFGKIAQSNFLERFVRSCPNGLPALLPRPPLLYRSVRPTSILNASFASILLSV